MLFFGLFLLGTIPFAAHFAIDFGVPLHFVTWFLFGKETGTHSLGRLYSPVSFFRLQDDSFVFYGKQSRKWTLAVETPSRIRLLDVKSY